mgnify:CR=1 FL=1
MAYIPCSSPRFDKNFKRLTKKNRDLKDEALKEIIVFCIYSINYCLILDFLFPSCHDFGCLLIDKIMMIYI